MFLTYHRPSLFCNDSDSVGLGEPLWAFWDWTSQGQCSAQIKLRCGSQHSRASSASKKERSSTRKKRRESSWKPWELRCPVQGWGSGLSLSHVKHRCQNCAFLKERYIIIWRGLTWFKDVYQLLGLWLPFSTRAFWLKFKCHSSLAKTYLRTYFNYIF